MTTETTAEDRLSRIEARLDRIEDALQIKTAATSSPPSTLFATTPLSQSMPAAQPAASLETSVLHKEGNNLLGLVAIVCFIVAAGFLVKLSIDSGWFSPERRIISAYLFGVALIGAGFALLKKDWDYAALLPGAGVVVFYIASFAAFRLYHLVPFAGAIGLVLLSSALCLWLFRRLRHMAYAIIAACGSFLAPALIGYSVAGADFSFAYFLVCSVFFAGVSVWVQSRRLWLVSAYLSVLMTGAIGNWHQIAVQMAIFPALEVGVFASAGYWLSRRLGKPLPLAYAFSFYTLTVLFYGYEYGALRYLSADAAPWVMIAAAVLLMVPFVWPNKVVKQGECAHALALAFASVAAYHSGYIVLMPENLRPLLLAVLLAAGAMGFPRMGQGQANKSLWLIPLLAAGLVAVWEYYALIIHLTDGSNLRPWVLNGFAVLLAAWLLIIRGRAFWLRQAFYDVILLATTHALAIVTLHAFADSTGSLAVSAAWLFYAMAVVAFAYRHKDRMVAQSALIVLVVAAGKALLFDVSQASPVVRILCLVLTGGVLYGCQYFMRRMANWTQK